MTSIEHKLQTDATARLIERAHEAADMLEVMDSNPIAWFDHALEARLLAGEIRDCLTDLESEHPHCDLEEVSA